jgi:hypothetical protein
MPRTDSDLFGDRLEQRLRAELNRIEPPQSSPRYLSSTHHRVATWRIAPAALAVAVAGVLGLTAYAATGSPNPAVWTEHVMNRNGTNTPPASTPGPSNPTPSHAAPAAPAPASPVATHRPEPSDEPESTPSPGHDSDGGGGDDHASETPSPSPSPYGGDH